jgi:lysozyme
MSKIPGIELIKQFEGCCLQAYPDPKTGKLPITIGWGCTVREDGEKWKLGESITQERADALLFSQLQNSYLPVLKSTVPHWDEMNSNQQGALFSFAYNLGAHFMSANNFDSIHNALKNKDWDSVPACLLKYYNPGSSVASGLKRRRIAECKLWQGVQDASA